jgi:hypothetical protein
MKIKSLFISFILFVNVHNLFAVDNVYFFNVDRKNFGNYIKKEKIRSYLIYDHRFPNNCLLCRKMASSDDFCPKITKELKCAAISTNFLQDDVIIIFLYVNGKQVSFYNSWPGYFEYPQKKGKPFFDNRKGFTSFFKISDVKINNIFLDTTAYPLFAKDRLKDILITLKMHEYIAVASYNGVENDRDLFLNYDVEIEFFR